MTEKNNDNIFTQNNNSIIEYPGPKASTYTAYEDDEEEEQEQQNTEKQEIVNVDLENYFEIIMMTSPVSGIKLYIPKYEPSNAHVLMIQKHQKEAAP